MKDKSKSVIKRERVQKGLPPLSSPNEIISKWLGECRHVRSELSAWTIMPDSNRKDAKCSKCADFIQVDLTSHKATNVPDYENDESAWTQELYWKIEEAELRGSFMAHILEKNNRAISWQLVSATPSQKALALSRSIEEQELK